MSLATRAVTMWIAAMALVACSAGKVSSSESSQSPPEAGPIPLARFGVGEVHMTFQVGSGTGTVTLTYAITGNGNDYESTADGQADAAPESDAYVMEKYDLFACHLRSPGLTNSITRSDRLDPQAGQAQSPATLPQPSSPRLPKHIA
jgi:hypothetical protein